MSDPRTGGVTEPPRKTKKNGVKNLNGAQAIPEFHHISWMVQVRPGLFTSWDCGRCKAQCMKLWSFTANALQRSRCGKISLPIR